MRVYIPLVGLVFISGNFVGAHEQAEPRYQVTELEDARSNVDANVPLAINRHGTITGDPAFLWRNRRLIEMTGDGSITPFVGLGINDRNQVVGGGATQNGTRGFIWRQGKLTQIGDLPGGLAFSVANDINNLGQVVGSSDSAAGREAVLWEDGNLMSLGDLPGGPTDSEASAINDRTVVVGTGRTESGIFAFVWRDGVMRALPVPEGTTRSFASDINNFNVVVGEATIAGLLEPVLWRGNSVKLLPNLSPELIQGIAFGINDAGTVVGSSATAALVEQEAATLWIGGNVYDLNDLIADDDPLKPCIHVVEATAINERGDITAQGINTCRGDFVVAFLLEPVTKQKRR